jgi:hypothetical protein
VIEILSRFRLGMKLLGETVGQMDIITNFLCWIKIKRGGLGQKGEFGVVSFHNKP